MRRAPSERRLRARLRRSLSRWRRSLKEDRVMKRAATRQASIVGLRKEAFFMGSMNALEIAIAAVGGALRET